MTDYSDDHGFRWQRPHTEQEIDAIVTGMPDDRLAENYRRASEHPGTEWERLLGAEVARRGLAPDRNPES